MELARLMKIKNQIAISILIHTSRVADAVDLPEQEVIDQHLEFCGVAFKFLQLLCEGHFEEM